MPKLRTIEIICSKCHQGLFKYYKGGSGGLVKCYEYKIIKDLTNSRLTCPKCENKYARPIVIQGKAARKIIQGKIIVKGMSRK